MALIDEIREKFARRAFEFSYHALGQTIRRNITVDETCQSIGAGEVIEDYPDDKYGRSCLIFGPTRSGRLLHVQCSYPCQTKVEMSGVSPK